MKYIKINLFALLILSILFIFLNNTHVFASSNIIKNNTYERSQIIYPQTALFVPSNGGGPIPPTTLNSSGVQNPLVGSSLNSPSGIVPFIFSIILPILYGIVGVIVLGLFSYAGFLLMVSNGDTNKVAKAKSVLTGAIIGASIILLAYVISLVLVHTV